jgi:hypothetical protein
MKKLIFTLALMTLLYAPVFSQGLGIGIKAGANFSNLSIDNVSTDGITMYHVGAYANINFSEKWGITPEVLWSAQGADLNNVEFRTDYVLVPIMLRWRFIDLLSAEIGPQFNILTKAELAGTDIKDDLKSSSYSMAVGALIHLPLGFNGGVRYLIGMSNLSDDDNEDIKDQTFQIYVGWTIFGAK